MRFYSQAGQDFFVYNNYFRGKRGGTFVEIGAYDGEKFSNCVALEDSMDWTGVCVEPLPRQFEAMKKRRKATCLNIALADFEGEADFLDVDTQHVEKMLSGLVQNYDARQKEVFVQEKHKQSIIKVKVRPVQDVLNENGISHIDYCSLDVEGAEMMILKAWDFAKHPVDVFSIENNYDDATIREFMEANGFEFVTKFHGYDDLYARKGIKRAPTTTAILDVRPGLADRDEKVRAWHLALDRQTRQGDFERITVFSAGEKPTDGIPGSVITSDKPINTGQAYNLALAAMNTPYVLILPINDRLFDGALAQMQENLDQGAPWIGGDWIVATTPEAQNRIERTMSNTAFDAVRSWPPAEGVRARLGNTTEHTNWVGPAFLYQNYLHGRFGRFPWRFGDMTLLPGYEAEVWCKTIAANNIDLTVLPKVLGNVWIDVNEPRQRVDLPSEFWERIQKVGLAL